MNAVEPAKTGRTPAAAYQDTELGRALLQTRVTRFAALVFLVALVFLPIGIAVRAVVPVAPATGLGGAFGMASWLHLACVVLFGTTWLFVQRGTHSEVVLRAADAVMTIGGAFAFELTGLFARSSARPDWFMVFVVAQLLAIRATLIPCGARGSRLIALAALAPIPLVSYAVVSRNPLPEGPSALGIALASSANSLLVFVVSVVVSGTVHGLRERVREAMKLGQYTLDHKIGEGGMGIVYKASHAMLRRPTAIKLLPAERAGEHNLARFEREVQLTSMLTHPNTVSIYDFGRTPEGSFYYAMEYLEGFDLETLIAADGPQEPGRVVHLLAQMCGALAEAHAVGLIHRDVKPANVLLCERGGTPDVVKVLDFGLVKQIGPAEDTATSESTVNTIIGTPLYLSPEAITAPGDLDGRSDLYALGCVAYALLTGAPPFTGASVVEVCGHHLHTPPPPLSERAAGRVPRDLERVIVRCLAKSRDDRPEDALALRRDLLACTAASDWNVERALAWWTTRGRAIVASGEAARPRPSTAPPSMILTRAVS